MTKKAKTQMDKLTAGYEQFIKGKEVKADGLQSFQKALKKATKPKLRGSK